MTLQIIVPGLTVTDPSSPVLRADPILPATRALVLADVTHPSKARDAGIPATIPNHAAAQAAALIGATEASVASAGLTNPYTGQTPAQGKLERTLKGGLYLLQSQVNDTASNSGGSPLPNGIGAFLGANPTHDLYLSVWGRMIRDAPNDGTSGSGSSTSAPVGPALRSANNYWAGFAQTRSSKNVSLRPTTPAIRIASVFNREADGRFYASGAVNDRDSAYGTSAPASFLRIGPDQSVFLHALPSYVLYRWYLEDLTVSGRTWDQVHAIDQALYNRLFAAGGRFNGDAITTDPATIP
jgi:hypothetical protein